MRTRGKGEDWKGRYKEENIYIIFSHDFRFCKF